MPSNLPALNSDQQGDLAELEVALRAVFPEIGQLAPLRFLGHGFRSVAIETAGGQVFRIGKNPAGAVGHAKEARFLPNLRERLTIAVPDPRWHTGPTEQFPFGVIGYPKLPGAALDPATHSHLDLTMVAADVAGFLLELHRFPAEEAVALGLPPSGGDRTELEAICADVLPALRDALATQEYRTVSRWWDSLLTDQALHQYEPVVQHGDLWYENILVDDAGQTVSGIIDFERAAIGDPAQDFATLMHLGEWFTDKVINMYRAAGGTLGEYFHHRLRRRWQLREFDGLRFSILFDEHEEFKDSLNKLRRGPIFTS